MYIEKLEWGNLSKTLEVYSLLTELMEAKHFPVEVHTYIHYYMYVCFRGFHSPNLFLILGCVVLFFSFLYIPLYFRLVCYMHICFYYTWSRDMSTKNVQFLDFFQTALKMLDSNFPDEHVRKFAVSALHELADDELEDILLQLTQVGGAVSTVT